MISIAISVLKRTMQEWFTLALDSWDRFWFAPRYTDTLAVLRIVTGAMLVYSHLVLASDLGSFIGTEAWINQDTARALHDGSFGEDTAAWSYLWNLNSDALIWVHHLVTILVSTAFMVGFLTRIMGPLAWFLQIMVLHRLMGSLFGLDQIVTYCAMYLAFTPCGSLYSVDAWLRKRRVDHGKMESASRWGRWLFPAYEPSVAANVGTRLLQLHLCVIYLFGGLAKARGQLWWDGTALWYAIGNYEYQSWDVTFLSDYPSVFTALTHFTLIWEVFYCALVWSKLARPIAIGIAVAVHGGIALFLGMATFGTMMIAANGIFLSPCLFRRMRGIETAKAGSLEPRPSSPAVTDDEVTKRLGELEKAEKAFKKRYVKLKSREAKVEERNERLKTTKAKLREKLKEGTLSMSDSYLDHLGADSGIHLAGDATNGDDDDSLLDLKLSDPDLLNPGSDDAR